MHSGRALTSPSRSITGPSNLTTRKRAPSSIPNSAFPSKKSNTRLSPDMENLNINTDDAIAPQRPITVPVDMTQHSQARRPSQIQGSSQRYSQVQSSASQLTGGGSLLRRFNKNEKPTTKKLITDSRNVKDPEVQRRYLRNIIEYLQRTEYQGPTPPRNIRALTARDFQAMFKHLIARLIPSYQFKRKFEDDVLDVLRELNYILVDTISPKSLLSVGALHSNPQFFGLLHWLVESCKAKDVGIRVENEEPLPNVIGDDGLSQLFHEYALATYHIYMDGSDDFNDVDRELQDVFGEASESNKTVFEELTSTNIALKKEVEQAEAQGSALIALKKRSQELARDFSKFQAFIDLRKKKNIKYETLNARVKDEVERLNQQLSLLETEKAQIQIKIKEKKVPEQELMAAYQKHNEIQLHYANKAAESEEVKKELKEKNEKLIIMKQQLGRDVEHYNSRAKSIPSTVLESKNIFIHFNAIGTSLKAICGLDIESDLLPDIEALETKFKLDFAKITDETSTLRLKLEDTKAVIQELHKDIEYYEKVVAESKKSYNEDHTSYLQACERHNLIVDKQIRAFSKGRSKIREQVLNAKDELVRSEQRLKELSLVTDKLRVEALQKIEPFFSKLRNTHQVITTQAEDSRETLAKSLNELTLLEQ